MSVFFEVLVPVTLGHITDVLWKHVASKSKNFLLWSVRKTAHLHVAPTPKNGISISIRPPSMIIICNENWLLWRIKY